MKALLPSDRAAVVGVIDPDALAADTYETGWISMSDFQSVMAIIMAGSLGSSATLNAKFEQGQGAAGANPQDVPGKAITALTQAGTDSDKQAVLNCFADDLDLADGYDHVRLSMTIGAATSDAGALVLGFDARYEPASNNDLASVDEIV